LGENTFLPAMSKAQSTPAPAVELIGIEKSFGPVRANRNVTLEIAKGSIHGIVGENGAGKSTLMSILYGFYHADAGEIRIDGKNLRIANSQAAISAGIGMVFQHFMLVDELSVLENVMLGAEGGAWLATGAARARAALEGFARDYGLAIDPDARIGDLSIGQHQRVEIIKTLYRGANVLVLDEPTAVLTPAEATVLFKLLAALKAQGKTIILITHKLQEVMAATDRVSVMRRGEIVATMETASTSPRELAALMVGREVLLRVEKKPGEAGPPMLEVERLAVVDGRGVTRLSDISFTLRQGEIVGIAGVAGNGQSELLAALSGIASINAGSISLAGTRLDARAINPRALRRAGLLHVPEDRLRMGLVPPFPAFESAALGFTDEARYGRGLWPRISHGAWTITTCARAILSSRRPNSQAAISRRSCLRVKSSARPRCCSLGSRHAVLISGPSSSSIAACSSCATQASPSSSSRWSSRRSWP
jgi:general nucleoside transport system ATP-binding protein